MPGICSWQQGSHESPGSVLAILRTERLQGQLEKEPGAVSAQMCCSYFHPESWGPEVSSCCHVGHSKARSTCAHFYGGLCSPAGQLQGTVQIHQVSNHSHRFPHSQNDKDWSQAVWSAQGCPLEGSAGCPSSQVSTQHQPGQTTVPLQRVAQSRQPHFQQTPEHLFFLLSKNKLIVTAKP